MSLPTPHFEKIQAALANSKLPARDRPRLKAAIDRYQQWIRDLSAVKGSHKIVLNRMVELLNTYKLYVDVNIIFDSEDDFLYRQKGQLKLDNSIIEEFLPWLLHKPLFPNLDASFSRGPTNCYSAIYFESTLADQQSGAGIRVRTKDQDFALSRKLYIRASHSPDFVDSTQVDTFIAYVATEIKTNLDKTMFQEACATARDLRIAVPGSRYFLMCEWLDMTPVSTAPTDIEEVLILRGAKRLPSNIRKNYSASARRRDLRDEYIAHLKKHPFRADVFKRWLNHIHALLSDSNPGEKDVLSKGFF
jgi:hypothetical protein